MGADGPVDVRNGDTGHEAGEAIVSVRAQRERTPLYAKRIKVHPAKIGGAFRTVKWAVLVACLAFYYIAPWLRWDRGPMRPTRRLLIDLPGRRAYFFCLEIWPQEVYFLTGLLILAAIGAVPGHQPVRPRLVRLRLPADRVDRSLHAGRTLDRGRPQRPHPPRQGAAAASARSAKRTAKHAAWLAIALATGGAWVFYFNDAPTLFVKIFTGRRPVADLLLHRPVHAPPLICWPAWRASRSAPICAPGRASSRRCSTSSR